MTKGIEALVEPELLVWARRSARMTVEEAAKKAGTKPDILASWEAGERRPTIIQLRKLANAYKRPLAVFYLPEPPRDFQPMRDFRRFPGEIAGRESPQLQLEIRNAYERSEIALELYERLEGEPPSFTLEVSLSDDPDILANTIRDWLGITYEDQVRFRDQYDAFNSWRSALEKVGVLVFQTSGVDLSEMRGLSISETPFPVVVVNNADVPVARIFTMLHEFVHILLRAGGICDLTEAHQSLEERRVEVFSNRVAGAVMVPRDYLMLENLVSRKQQGEEWSEEEIVKLARRYRASREVLLRRLLICDRITREFYQEKRREYEEQREEERPTGGFLPPDREAISKVGSLFIRLVLNNYYSENITASDVSDFLNVRLKHMGKIERAVMGHVTAFGALG